MSCTSRRTQPSVAFATPPEPANPKEQEIPVGFQAPVDAEWPAATRGLGFITGSFRGSKPSMYG